MGLLAFTGVHWRLFGCTGVNGFLLELTYGEVYRVPMEEAFSRSLPEHMERVRGQLCSCFRVSGFGSGFGFREGSRDTTPCKVTPVILHGVVSPEREDDGWVKTTKAPGQAPNPEP